MACNAGPKIVNDGLVLALDAGNTESYPTPITYVGGTSESSDSSSFTLNGLQAGDLVLYFGARDSSTLNTPTGESWTAIPGLGTQPDNDGTPSSAAFYVFASGTSVTASGLNILSRSVHVMIAFRNVDSTNPFDVNATQVDLIGGLPNPPSITPVTNNSMIVAVGLQDDEDIATSISPPTGYTTALNMDSQGGANDAGLSGATIMTAYKLLATAAAEDPGAFTSSNGGAIDPNKGISIALRSENTTTSTSTWTDLSGKGNNGTLTNGPTFDSGNGGSIVFDGTDDYVTTGTTLTDADELYANTGNAWSTSSWFNVDVISGVNKTVTGRSGGFGVLASYGVWINDANLRVILRGGTTTDISTSIATNTWYNVVVTWDGTTANGYLNGEYYTTIPVGTASNQTTYNFNIGATQSGLLHYFDGKISQTLVYNRALTAAEVTQNFNALRGRFE